MNLNILINRLVPEAVIPKNATPLDTGYDLVTIEEPKIVGERIGADCWARIDYVEYKTGLKISPQKIIDAHPAGIRLGSKHSIPEKVFYTLLFPRSSVSKYNLILANSVGVVDNQYRGELLLRFKYIWQPEDYLIDTSFGVTRLFGTINAKKIYQKGDKVAQIAAVELNSINFIEVQNLDETHRNEGGFGSTGK